MRTVGGMNEVGGVGRTELSILSDMPQKVDADRNHTQYSKDREKFREVLSTAGLVPLSCSLQSSEEFRLNSNG